MHLNILQKHVFRSRPVVLFHLLNMKHYGLTNVIHLMQHDENYERVAIQQIELLSFPKRSLNFGLRKKKKSEKSSGKKIGCLCFMSLSK